MDLAIIYELRANDVKEEHIELIMDRVKNRLTEELVATYNNRVKSYNKSQLVKLYEILGIK